MFTFIVGALVEEESEMGAGVIDGGFRGGGGGNTAVKCAKYSPGLNSLTSSMKCASGEWGEVEVEAEGCLRGLIAYVILLAGTFIRRSRGSSCQRSLAYCS